MTSAWSHCVECLYVILFNKNYVKQEILQKAEPIIYYFIIDIPFTLNKCNETILKC